MVIFLDEPTIVTLDQSTIKNIPNHLRRLISHIGKNNPTQIELMNALVIASGLETGFIGDWCYGEEDIKDVLNAYALNRYYSFDRRLLLDFAKMPTQPDDSHNIFRFKFSLEPEREILVYTIDSGDLLLVTAHLIDNSVITSTRNICLPVSRYIVRKRPSLQDLPGNFRNLRELSIKLKNELFLPLRNEIFDFLSLQGMMFNVLKFDIRKYLKRKDLQSLSCTCKTIRDALSIHQ